MQAFIFGIVIGSVIAFWGLKINQSKKNSHKSASLLKAATIYLKNGWFLGALKNLHVANYIQSTPQINYAIGYASFKLEDFEEATRGFWHSTCLYLEQKEKVGWEDEYYLRAFSCDSYFMWALSEAMQDNETSWRNCLKYCNFAINDIESGLLPRVVEKRCAPFVELNDYEAAFRILRIFSGLFSKESSSEETWTDLKWLNSEFEAVPHSIRALQEFFEACDNKGGLNEAEAKEVWYSKIRPVIISNKEVVYI